MNKLFKWWNLMCGKYLCHYCDNIFLPGFRYGGNCMFCHKCRTTYVFGWKKSNFYQRWKNGYDAIGDEKNLEHIILPFKFRSLKLENDSGSVHLDLISKVTKIILDKWWDGYPKFEFPQLMNITPLNIQDKVKTLILFS